MSIFTRLFKRKVDDEQVASPITEDINRKEATPENNPKEATPGNDATRVYHLIVLDESGSMFNLRNATISGCNETIQTVRALQKDNPSQRHFVAIYLFQGECSKYIIKNVPIDQVREITESDYRPNSNTPLYDALGHTLTEMRAVVKAENTLGYVTIITDGYENSSRVYSLDMVRVLIDELKKMGVVFSFVGANIDAGKYAASMHISNAMQFNPNEEDTRRMWEQELMSKRRSSAKYNFMRKYMAMGEDMFGAEENSGNYYERDVDNDRIAPDVITSLSVNEVFVFGSDASGAHGGGAAAYAVAHFGAIVGQAEGLQGQSYAITTTGVTEKVMYESIERFCVFAKNHPEKTFLVTAVGCGVAGYGAYYVGPMFRKAVQLKNVKLPKQFWDFNNMSL